MPAGKPGFDPLIVNAVSRAIAISFVHVRAFRPIRSQGIHYLASMEPIDIPSAQEFINRLPATAKRDMMEWVWNADTSLNTFATEMFQHELEMAGLMGDDSAVVITDDRPFNEYYLLRRWLK